MASGARLRAVSRGVLLVWILAFTGEGLAVVACCTPAGGNHDPAAGHGGGHGPGSHHGDAPRGPEHRHCPLPELRDAAFLPAKAAELPLPRPVQAPPPHGVEHPSLMRAHTRRVQPRAPPPTDVLRLIPRLRI